MPPYLGLYGSASSMATSPSPSSCGWMLPNVLWRDGAAGDAYESGVGCCEDPPASRGAAWGAAMLYRGRLAGGASAG
jgi:hypothetical protein